MHRKVESQAPLADSIIVSLAQRHARSIAPTNLLCGHRPRPTTNRRLALRQTTDPLASGLTHGLVAHLLPPKCRTPPHAHKKTPDLNLGFCKTIKTDQAPAGGSTGITGGRVNELSEARLTTISVMR